MDPALKEKVLRRISDQLDKDGTIIEDIMANRWQRFYMWLQRVCADIWESIKSYARKIWDWVVDLFS